MPLFLTLVGTQVLCRFREKGVEKILLFLKLVVYFYYFTSVLIPSIIYLIRGKDGNK